MNIFETKTFPTAMYLLLIIASLLIVFNLAGFTDEFNIDNQLKEKLENQEKIFDYKITGLAAKDNEKNETDNETSKDKNENRVYSEKSYFIYYSILFFTFIFIIIIFFIVLLPVIKNYT